MLPGFGFTVVLASGGLDLSVGNTLSCVGALYALYSRSMPLVFAILLAMLSGAGAV